MKLFLNAELGKILGSKDKAGNFSSKHFFVFKTICEKQI
jgi:hypothetical protein